MGKATGIGNAVQSSISAPRAISTSNARHSHVPRRLESHSRPAPRRASRVAGADARAAEAVVRANRRLASLQYEPGSERRYDVFAERADDAAAHDAVVPARDGADDDELHAHHHRVVAAA